MAGPRRTASDFGSGSATEAVHPRATRSDTLPPEAIVALMLAEEAKAIARGTHRRRDAIGRAARLAADKLGAGGRLVYVGAGTSGRLGTLDAVECVPTFGVPPSRLVPIIAGGPSALTRSVEGAEDNTRDAEQRMRRAAVGPTDVVCGIAASGVTPFVRAALEYARFRRAATIFVTCGAIEGPAPADVVIALETGPEVIAGSTRLKAGTATKIVLNAISTAAFVLLGKTYGGPDGRRAADQRQALGTRHPDRALALGPRRGRGAQADREGGRARQGRAGDAPRQRSAAKRARAADDAQEGRCEPIVGDLPVRAPPRRP